MSLPSLSPLVNRKSEVLGEISAVRCSADTSTIDLLAIFASEACSLCHLIFARGGRMEVESVLLSIPTTKDLDDLERKSVEEYSAWFAEWTRNTIEPGTGERILLVKVDEAQSWFLRVPLTLFARKGLSGF